MALVKFSDYVIAASGSTAGSTYTRTKYGTQRKAKIVKNSSDTDLQRYVRGLFAVIASGWNNLTTEQADTWRNSQGLTRQNSVGDNYVLKGRPLYLALNGERQVIGQPLLSSAPILNSPPPFTSSFDVDATPSSEEVVINLQSPGILTGENLVVEMASPRMSTSKSFQKNEYRQLAVITSNLSSQIDITADVVSKYGVITDQAYYSVRLKLVNVASGVSSGWFYVTAQAEV